MKAAGVPLSHIKERGQWVSDCIFKYIKPTVSDKLKWELYYVRLFVWRLFGMFNKYLSNIHMSKQITDFLLFISLMFLRISQK